MSYFRDDANDTKDWPSDVFQKGCDDRCGAGTSLSPEAQENAARSQDPSQAAAAGRERTRLAERIARASAALGTTLYGVI